MQWGHNQLAKDLADHLMKNPDRIIWTDMQLGPSGSPRPDVYTIPKSYSNFRPLAYEVKVSVSDFRSDITKGKWQSYLKYACAVIFAVPKGLINKNDVPTGCGLIVRSESGWRMVKGPTLVPVKNELPADFWIKLVIDGVNRSHYQKRNIELNQRLVHKKLNKKYGEALSNLLAERDKAEENLKQRIEFIRERYKVLDVFSQADRERHNLEELRSIKAELCGILGIDQNSSRWDIERALKQKIKLLEAETLVSESRKSLDQAIQLIEKNLDSLKGIQRPFTVVEQV